MPSTGYSNPLSCQLMASLPFIPQTPRSSKNSQASAEQLLGPTARSRDRLLQGEQPSGMHRACTSSHLLSGFPSCTAPSMAAGQTLLPVIPQPCSSKLQQRAKETYFQYPAHRHFKQFVHLFESQREHFYSYYTSLPTHPQ